MRVVTVRQSIQFAIDNRVFHECRTSFFATLSFGWVDRFLGLFCMNLQETHSKVDRQTDMFELYRAVFCIWQTKSIDAQ